MKKNFARLLLSGFTATLISLSSLSIAAEIGLPQTIKLIVPFTTGGSNDIFARALSEQLSAKLGSTVIVDNKPGAGGVVGAAEVARAKPNGGTLLFSSNSFVTRAAVDTNLPFNHRTSFTPVAMVAQGALLLVVANHTPYKTTADLVKDAAKKQVNYATAGIGSIAHLSTELMNSMAGIQMTHIPYKGISPALTDMVGGRVEALIATPASVGGALRANQVRPIAVTTSTPSPFYPELPPMAQAIPGYSVDVWWGVLGPAGMPQAIVDRLNQAINEVSQSPKMKEIFSKEAAVPYIMSAKEFGAYMNQELDKWQKVAKERNIKLAD
ncbi:tripartite tricarboxylate transporter substrate binding protein [Zwartia panacis]|uniref:tripartite tricarboxylate transporter substrate binding protein n=1 Tax=Zwartia panacis TaxID=2683345 RepID=UPI0025B619DB|nr:tripartite tricarboxylate transporter substrate binding protein [Zwartia panacis]MDN4018453.1 tripartite tricarboxylate transporter substrate binding protein [Zwartia panacis]